MAVGSVLVRADSKAALSLSKRAAALGSQRHELSFGYVIRLSPLATMSEGEHDTRGIDAHSSL